MTPGTEASPPPRAPKQAMTRGSLRLSAYLACGRSGDAAAQFRATRHSAFAHGGPPVLVHWSSVGRWAMQLRGSAAHCSAQLLARPEVPPDGGWARVDRTSPPAGWIASALEVA